MFQRLEDALDIEFEVAPPAQEGKPKQMPGGCGTAKSVRLQSR